MQEKFTDHLFQLIRDNDFRIRKHACEALPAFIKQFTDQKELFKYSNLLDDFAKENIFDQISIPMQIGGVADEKLQSKLSKMLYKLSNTLLNIEDKNQLVIK